MGVLLAEGDRVKRENGSEGRRDELEVEKGRHTRWDKNFSLHGIEFEERSWGR